MFSRNVKPGMFRLGIAPKETFLTYSTQFVFLIIRFVSGNVVMVVIDMCGKRPIKREWIYGITWNHVYFNISVHFIVDTMFILKLVFLNYIFIYTIYSKTWRVKSKAKNNGYNNNKTTTKTIVITTIQPLKLLSRLKQKVIKKH